MTAVGRRCGQRGHRAGHEPRANRWSKRPDLHDGSTWLYSEDGIACADGGADGAGAGGGGGTGGGVGRPAVRRPGRGGGAWRRGRRRGDGGQHWNGRHRRSRRPRWRGGVAGTGGAAGRGGTRRCSAGDRRAQPDAVARAAAAGAAGRGGASGQRRSAGGQPAAAAKADRPAGSIGCATQPVRDHGDAVVAGASTYLRLHRDARGRLPAHLDGNQGIDYALVDASSHSPTTPAAAAPS